MKAFLKKHKKKIIISLVLLAVGFGGYKFLFANKASTAKDFTQFKVTSRNISVTIDGSGTIQSSYRQEISSKVDGTITKVNLKEGDKVTKGDLMIELDDQDIVKEVERVKLSIRQAQSDLVSAKKSISDLSAKAPISGQIIDFNFRKGDEINKGSVICSIKDDSELHVMLPFNKEQVKKISVGQKAEVYLQDYMQTVDGKVTYVDKLGRTVNGGGKVYDVEITVKNPGTLAEGIKASAEINGAMSMDSAELEYVSSRTVKSEVSGTVLSVQVKNNQTVSSGQVLFKMENTNLDDQLLVAQIKMSDLQLQLDSKLETQQNYKVYAPVTGTIVSQDIKVGDNIEKADKLAVVADYNQMEFQIDVDELDIAKIAAGMQANVTVDALENQTFTGEVTKVANEGTSTNGVATYPIIVKISNPKNIKGGMNANAEIVLQKKENVLALPTSAVQSMGPRKFVYAEKKAGDKSEDVVSTFGQNKGDKTINASTTTTNKKNSGKTKASLTAQKLKLNMKMKFVQTGIENDDYIEITSGLSEGDTVYIPVTKSSSNSRNAMMPMGGPMNGGGPPGGMPGGGRNNSRSIRSGGGPSGSK